VNNKNSAEWFAAAVRTSMHRRLRAWFRDQARDLPWRKTTDPYAIWVSEIMLQQTQVATVIDYYHRFLLRFPQVTDLANAELQEVLKYWEGLGYYRRARQMHAAAKQIVELHQGVFPSTFEAVLSLPGIGRYTAGAICSFAYDQSQPILEANTQRLYCRLMKWSDDPKSGVSQKAMWRFAEEFLPQKNAGEVNQALMELGSLVCTPTNPKCAKCPLQEYCPTSAANLQAEIPRPPKPKDFEHLHEVAWVIWDQDKVLVRECLPGERWEGLWDFPRFALDAEEQFEEGRQTQLQARFGLHVQAATLRMRIKHGVTKYKITLDCFDVQWKAGPQPTIGNYRWLRFDQLHEVPLHSTARRIAKSIQAGRSQ
jgi:A/G-specific adenine glycosylase